MGNPVEHSQSPRIHQLFARQVGVTLTYERIQVDRGGFAQAVSHFAAHGGGGLNVTLPFKVEAWRLCAQPGNRLSARAREAEAVNTLLIERGGGGGRERHNAALLGDNTDGIGMLRDIEHNLGLALGGARVLVLGAGGAVRGVVGALAERAPAALTIANRTANKAKEMAARLAGGDGGGDISGCGYERLAAEESGGYDLIINGTSASLGGELPPIDARCINEGSVVYDMMYGAQPTLFMRWAMQHGAARVSDGLGMLVEQAAESFYLWHHRRPDTAAVIRALRQPGQPDESEDA